MENQAYKVSILMSTYNGILYFDEQIESILNQTYTNFDIFIRDDGSTDKKFIQLLKTYEEKHYNIKIVYGHNIGVTKSNFELIKQCPTTYDYIVFADQDDVWVPKRIENSLQFASFLKIDIPLLLIGRLEYVDDKLNHLNYSSLSNNISFNNALVQNLASGCTSMINNRALMILKKYMPAKAVIHDWWIYLTISAYGTVAQEYNISIKYRQHSNNLLGGTTSIFKKNLKRVSKQLNKNIYKVYDQLNEFVEVHSSALSTEKNAAIQKLIKTEYSLKNKIFFLFDRKTAFRENNLDTFLLKFVILFSKKRVHDKRINEQHLRNKL